MAASSASRAATASGGSLLVGHIRSRWCAPNGSTTAVRVLERLQSTPPDDHGSSKPCVQSAEDRAVSVHRTSGSLRLNLLDNGTMKQRLAVRGKATHVGKDNVGRGVNLEPSVRIIELSGPGVGGRGVALLVGGPLTAAVPPIILDRRRHIESPWSVGRPEKVAPKPAGHRVGHVEGLVTADPLPTRSERFLPLAADRRRLWRLAPRERVGGRVVVAGQGARDVVPDVNGTGERSGELADLRARGAAACGLVPVHGRTKPVKRHSVPVVRTVSGELHPEIVVEPERAGVAHRPRREREVSGTNAVGDVRAGKGIISLGQRKPRVLGPAQKVIHILARLQRAARSKRFGEHRPPPCRFSSLVEQHKRRCEVVKARVGGTACG
eukprot:m.14916 g.14916  ORF g.14916 m.14916 type:complete len:381 (+) comp4845_c0_seq1:1886-3028(+)